MPSVVVPLNPAPEKPSLEEIPELKDPVVLNENVISSAEARNTQAKPNSPKRLV